VLVESIKNPSLLSGQKKKRMNDNEELNNLEGGEEL